MTVLAKGMVAMFPRIVSIPRAVLPKRVHDKILKTQIRIPTEGSATHQAYVTKRFLTDTPKSVATIATR